MLNDSNYQVFCLNFTQNFDPKCNIFLYRDGIPTYVNLRILVVCKIKDAINFYLSSTHMSLCKCIFCDSSFILLYKCTPTHTHRIENQLEFSAQQQCYFLFKFVFYLFLFPVCIHSGENSTTTTTYGMHIAARL